MIISTFICVVDWKYFLLILYVWYLLFNTEELTFAFPYLLASMIQEVKLTGSDEMTLRWLLVAKLHHGDYHWVLVLECGFEYLSLSWQLAEVGQYLPKFLHHLFRRWLGFLNQLYFCQWSIKCGKLFLQGWWCTVLVNGLNWC